MRLHKPHRLLLTKNNKYERETSSATKVRLIKPRGKRVGVGIGGWKRACYIQYLLLKQLATNLIYYCLESLERATAT